MDRFKLLKERILTLDFLLCQDISLNGEQRADLVESILKLGYKQSSQNQGSGWFVKTVSAPLKAVNFLFGTSDSPSTPGLRNIEIPKDVTVVEDTTFLSELPIIADRSSLLVDAISQCHTIAKDHFRDTIKRMAKDLTQKITKIQRSACKDQIDYKARIDEKNRLDELHHDLLERLRLSAEKYSSR